ncbi:MAG: acetamidase/formamidase family protein, partial [Nitrososphaerales archaeon]
LDDLGLISTLRWNADRQAQRSGLVVHFAAESSGARLPTNLETACKKALEYAIDFLMGKMKIDWYGAYVLCSVVADLKIFEVVDEPHVLCGVMIPKYIFEGIVA